MKRWGKYLFFVLSITIFLGIESKQISSHVADSAHPTLIGANVALQLYQLMKDTHEILMLKNIEYWAIAGTLLGAVRHGGQIPWDDDLDICLNKKQNNDFISLKPMFEALGYEIIPWSFGYKIFPTNGISVYEKLKNGIREKAPYKFPFMDVFLYEQKGNKIYYNWHFKYPRQDKDVAIYADELYPLKDYVYGNIVVKGPNKPLEYLFCCYGSDCMTIACYGKNHSHAGLVNKGKMKLRQKDRVPAMPTGPLQDRVSGLRTGNAFSLDVVKLSSTDMEQARRFLQTLCPVFVDAFEKGTEIQLKEEHPEAYEALITSGKTVRDILPVRFNKIIETIIAETSNVRAFYVSLAKNECNKIVGYALINLAPINYMLQSMIARNYVTAIISLPEHLLKPNTIVDDAYILSVGVIPSLQGYGLGKKLIFSIFSEYPEMQNMYLLTAASKTNYAIQSFYEYLGFVRKGLLLTSDNNEKILYCFNNALAKKSFGSKAIGTMTAPLFERDDMRDMVQEIVKII